MSKRIFISYKRNADPDVQFVDGFTTELRNRGHRVFIDRGMLVGEDWVKRITEEIQSADFLIFVISEQSMQSQMVAEEARLAAMSCQTNGAPQILPLRLAYDGALPYDLGAILNRLNYAMWVTPNDDARVYGELLAAIERKVCLPTPRLPNAPLSPEVPVPQANPLVCLEAPEGTMAAESRFYVERDADFIVADEQANQGYTLTIQAARQMGKSSLLGRVMARARQNGVSTAFIDFQAFGHDELVDPKRLYYQFCVLIEESLDLSFQVDDYWSGPLSEPQKCRRFVERRVLPQLRGSGLLLALDEADALLASPSRSDFFGMLRSWNNYRQTKPEWRRFSLATAISTEPAMLIESLTQSPFNVGTTVKLEDFSIENLALLAGRHGVFLERQELESVYYLLNGHPYLTRKALYLLAKRRYELSELISEAPSETGPFGDHLRAIMSRLHMRDGLINAVRQTVASEGIDSEARHRLISGGIIKEMSGRLVLRNRLYELYFKRAIKS